MFETHISECSEFNIEEQNILDDNDIKNSNFINNLKTDLVIAKFTMSYCYFTRVISILN